MVAVPGSEMLGAIFTCYIQSLLIRLLWDFWSLCFMP